MIQSDENGSVTAFRDTAAQLRERLREAAVDHASFERRIQPCMLDSCWATCCHDGVFLSDEEASVIAALIEENTERLTGYDVPVSTESIIRQPDGACRTAVEVASKDDLAEDFPPHFSKTRCVFLDAQHRCVLQLLSCDLGRPSWFYKPIGCWMHPLTLRPLRRGDARPLLRLPGAEDDPLRSAEYPGFASCTPCGRACAGGRPAPEVLAPELQALSAIGGRDFVAELDAPQA
ncbi:MAG: hypothetical protein R3F13_15115 [Prosthecobacter sp.]